MQLTQLDHVLKRPDTYIGSVEPITQPMWIYDSDAKALAYRSVLSILCDRRIADSLTRRAITFVPGLYKIVDEILVNASDNKVSSYPASSSSTAADVLLVRSETPRWTR